METALSQITKLPETREQQKTFVNAAVEEICNGDLDILRIFTKLRIIQDTIKDILSAPVVENLAILAAAKYPKGECDVFGNKLTLAARKNYDFSECNDYTLNNLEKDLKHTKTKIKERQTFLQSLKPGMIAVDEITGEQLKMPTFTVTEYITVK